MLHWIGNKKCISTFVTLWSEISNCVWLRDQNNNQGGIPNSGRLHNKHLLICCWFEPQRLTLELLTNINKAGHQNGLLIWGFRPRYARFPSQGPLSDINCLILCFSSSYWWLLALDTGTLVGCLWTACVLSCFSPVLPRGLYPARLLCPRDSPGENTGVGCHALLQGIFPTWGSNPCLLSLLHWKEGSLPLVPPRKPLPLAEGWAIGHLWLNFWTDHNSR